MNRIIKEVVVKFKTGNKCYYDLAHVLGSQSIFQGIWKPIIYYFDQSGDPVRNKNMATKEIKKENVFSF